MLEELTPELLETKERLGVLDMFEALVLRRLRGQRTPQPDIEVRVELDADEKKRRRDLEAVMAKYRAELEADREKRRQEAFAEIERRGGPGAVQAVRNELARRAYIAKMQQAMQANQFVFPGAFGAQGTTNTSAGSSGSTNTFFFR